MMHRRSVVEMHKHVKKGRIEMTNMKKTIKTNDFDEFVKSESSK